MTEPVLDAGVASATIALVVFGADEAGKPHASTFTADEAALAQKAAELMGMHVLRVGDTDEHCALAGKLPVGRLFASGKGFVPFVKRPLFDALCAASGLSPEAELARKVEAAAAAATSAVDVAGDPPDLPLHWNAIQPGSLVLATTGGADEPWYESIIVEDKGDDLFVLRWRGWPDEPLFLRRRDQVGLLPLNEVVTG